jgi:hypothetical protein
MYYRADDVGLYCGVADAVDLHERSDNIRLLGGAAQRECLYGDADGNRLLCRLANAVDLHKRTDDGWLFGSLADAVSMLN